jgi:rare lipoprotein A
MNKIIIISAILLSITFNCEAKKHNKKPVIDKHYVAVGKGSWYGYDFHNHRAANGKRFNMWAMTVAHMSIRLNRKVKITNLANNRTVIATVTDRGDFAKYRRIVDVSKGVKMALKMNDIGNLRIETIE